MMFIPPPGSCLMRMYRASVPPTMGMMGGCPYETDGEVYFFDITASTWQKSVSPNAPPEVRMPRSHHSANIWGTIMVIYGGLSSGMTLNHLLTFDLVRFQWTVIKPTAPLPKVCGHSCFVKDDILFVAGGCRENCSHFVGISLVDGSRVSVSAHLPKMELTVGLAATCYDPQFERLYICGGYSVNGDVEEGCIDRLHIIDLQHKTIGSVFSALTSHCPSPRCGHSMMLWGHKLYMFGGCNRLPLLNGEWVFCDFSNSVWSFTPPPAGFDLLTLRELLQESELRLGASPRVHSPSDV
jgi:hypothetical protein